MLEKGLSYELIAKWAHDREETAEPAHNSLTDYQAFRYVVVAECHMKRQNVGFKSTTGFIPWFCSYGVRLVLIDRRRVQGCEKRRTERPLLFSQSSGYEQYGVTGIRLDPPASKPPDMQVAQCIGGVCVVIAGQQ